MTESTTLDLTLGVLLVTLIFTSMLFGVSCIQTGYYYRQNGQDRYLLKCMVAVMWALDATHQTFFTCTMYSYLVGQSAFSPENTQMIWTADAQMISNAAAIALIQSFYTSQIWRLSNNNIPLMVILTTFIAAGLGEIDIVALIY
ncbi:hypothetical protein A0H81_07992 [Grifola frondosa]|uniref:Uncharacterized protein n=1 Tax=Grifola frondosa TaxID=5627 RepID=A0A1C7M529_GRIFR|nr:hypothetical protein A0H81_07992 [Grifola frondosa]